MTDFVNGGYWLSSTAEQLPPDDIDATLYSHLFCGYAEIDPMNYRVTIPPAEAIIINHFSEIVRESNRDVKTLLSIRGGRDVFSQMASDLASRREFIKSSIDAAVKGEFNGLDLRWLYPSSEDDMNNFAILIKEWRQAAMEDAQSNNRWEWILVASVPNVPFVENNAEYPAAAIIENLDWVNLICYDFFTPTSFSDRTGPSSALYNPRIKFSNYAKFGIERWIHHLRNIPRKQIVFGIPFHGWAWKLVNINQHNVLSAADGPAVSVEDYVISPDGRIDYSEVKKFIDITNAENIPHDSKLVIAYTFADTTWITYESESTIADKIQFAKEKELLGYFGSNIAADDDIKTLANAAKANW